MNEAKGIFPPGTARHGPPSDKRRAAWARWQAHKSRWTPALDAELMGYVADGLSFTATAKRMGLSASQVSSRFKRLCEIMGWQAS